MKVSTMDQLYDYSSTLVAVCSFFLALCILLVGLRVYLRYATGAIGLDDYLLILGLILWSISTAFVIPSAWYGLGAHVEHYTIAQAVKANTYFFLFQHFYIWAIIPTKSSLCLTLIRIAKDGGCPWIMWPLYTIIFIVTALSIGFQVFVMTDCEPFAANWDKTIPYAICRDPIYSVAIWNAYSAVSIVIDWVIAVLPIFLLWRLQMRWAQKLPIMAVLALGVFASTATLIRMQTFVNLTNLEDYWYGIGPIVMWTVVEMGLVLTCGSLIAFRPLFRCFFTSSKSSGDSGRQSQLDYRLWPRKGHHKHSRIDSISIPPRVFRGRQSDDDMHPHVEIEGVDPDHDDEDRRRVSIVISMAAAKYKQ